MSKKIRGISEKLIRSTTLHRWAEFAENPIHTDSLLLFFTGENYYLFGDDASAASAVLGLPVLEAGLGPSLRVMREDVCMTATKLREAGHKVAICGDGTGKPGGHWRATVDVTMGDRRMSYLMASAGLGITGAGVKERLVFNYAPGEEVGPERVNAAMENMIAIADAESAEFKILSYKVTKLEFIHD
jgi:hypothetical protein